MKHYVYESPRAGHKRSDRIPEGDARNDFLLSRGWRLVETFDNDTETVTPVETEAEVPVERAAAEWVADSERFDFLKDEQRRALHNAGFTTADALRGAADDELRAVDGIGPAAVRDIRKAIKTAEA